MAVTDKLLQLPLENELNMLSHRGGASLRKTVFLLQLIKLSWYAPGQFMEQKPDVHCEYPLGHAPPTTGELVLLHTLGSMASWVVSGGQGMLLTHMLGSVVSSVIPAWHTNIHFSKETSYTYPDGHTMCDIFTPACEKARCLLEMVKALNRFLLVQVRISVHCR